VGSQDFQDSRVTVDSQDRVGIPVSQDLLATVDILDQELADILGTVVSVDPPAIPVHPGTVVSVDPRDILGSPVLQVTVDTRDIQDSLDSQGTLDTPGSQVILDSLVHLGTAGSQVLQGTADSVDFRDTQDFQVILGVE